MIKKYKLDKVQHKFLLFFLYMEHIDKPIQFEGEPIYYKINSLLKNECYMEDDREFLNHLGHSLKMIIGTNSKFNYHWKQYKKTSNRK